jgi:glycosyltransferase involved in cell wall biosynthesis
MLPLTDTDTELSLVYSSLDCFLHSATVGESFGYVLTEAMLCECPVVTASTPHVSNSQVEVVGHLVGGIVAGSTQELPEATAYLWSHRELAARFAPHMRDHVLSRFDADVVARQALKVAELALASPDRATLRERIALSGDLRDTVSDSEIDAMLRQTLGPPRQLDLLAMRLRHSVTVRRMIDLNFRRKLQALARRHEAARLEREQAEATRRRGSGGDGDGPRGDRGSDPDQSDQVHPIHRINRIHRAQQNNREVSPVTVSAVMPTYNNASYLREAIGSVITQTFTDWELIVIDDGSEDETPEILASIRDPRLRVRRLAAHSGRAAARNAGLELATGSYVAMCDSDDISLPHRFATQTAFLKAHPEVDVVSGHMMVFDDHSAPRRGTTFPEAPAEIHRRFRNGKMGVVHAASMLRARCFTAFGRYREELERAEDFEFLRRIHPFCSFRNLPEVVLLYRHEVTRTPWWKWLETRRYHRYAADYTIELMKYLKFNLMSWVRDVQTRRASESPLPRAAGQV